MVFLESHLREVPDPAKIGASLSGEPWWKA